MDLLSLIVMCGPWVAPATTFSVIQIESAGHPFAIHDNTTRRSYAPANLTDAERLANTLLRRAHRIDVGLMQINYEVWLRPAQVGLRAAFNPCLNIALGTTILSAAYARESAHTWAPSDALKSALSIYNSGDPQRALRYADRVIRVGHARARMARPNVPQEARD